MTEHNLSATDRERLADAIGAMPEASNVFDYTDEATTMIEAPVDLVADAIAPVVADMLAAARQEARDEAAAPVLALAEDADATAADANRAPDPLTGRTSQLRGFVLADDLRAALADPGALARIRAEAWPCANYTAPVTCLHAGTTTPCDWCREVTARIARGADDPAEAEPPDDRPCYRCGRNPAEGFASIWTAKDGERWYCHGDDDESPTCYEGANVADDPAEAARGGEGL